MQKTLIALQVAGYIHAKQVEKELKVQQTKATMNAWRNCLNDIPTLTKNAYTYLWNHYIPNFADLPQALQAHLTSRAGESEQEGNTQNTNEQDPPESNNFDNQAGNQEGLNTDPEHDPEHEHTSDSGTESNELEPEDDDTLSVEDMRQALLSAGETKKSLKDLSDEEIYAKYQALPN